MIGINISGYGDLTLKDAIFDPSVKYPQVVHRDQVMNACQDLSHAP